MTSLGARIRTARLADAEGLVALDRVLASAGAGMVIAPEQVRTVDAERARLDELERGAEAGQASCAIVAELEGRIVGSADLRQLSPARCRHVAVVSVGVHPDVQRRGLGRALMQHLLDHARRRGLHRIELYVRADNTKAHALYESLGFRHESTRRDFVRNDDGTFLDDRIYALFLGG